MVILIPTIKLSQNTLDRLKARGKFQDTWETIIIDLLDKVIDQEHPEWTKKSS